MISACTASHHIFIIPAPIILLHKQPPTLHNDKKARDSQSIDWQSQAEALPYNGSDRTKKKPFFQCEGDAL